MLGSPQIFLLFVLIALTGAGGAADQDETKQFGMADLAPFGAPGTSSVLDHPPGMMQTRARAVVRTIFPLALALPGGAKATQW